MYGVTHFETPSHYLCGEFKTKSLTKTLSVMKKNDNSKWWMDRKNPRTLKEFNNFTDLADRQRYDVFIDEQNSHDPTYKSPSERIEDMENQLCSFFEAPVTEVPLLICTCEAGVIMYVPFDSAVRQLNLVEFDPIRQKPEDDDYDIIRVIEGTEDEFCVALGDHNGKIIYYSNMNERLLTNHTEPVVSLMKSLADPDPKKRIFRNRDGKEELFTGKLMFLTNNAHIYKLNEEILSFAKRIDISGLTVRETIECYDYQFSYRHSADPYLYDKDYFEHDRFNAEIFKFLLDNREEIDPDKFTVRNLGKIVDSVYSCLKMNKMLVEDPQLMRGFGITRPRDWHDEALFKLHETQGSFWW